jgi:hypothetical protein
MIQRMKVAALVTATLLGCGGGETQNALASRSNALTTADGRLCSGPVTTAQVNAYMGITPPTDTGLVIPVGGSVVVTATGSWAVGGNYGTFGPDGSTNPVNKESCMLVPTSPMGTLIGSLNGGSTWFPIGSGPTTIYGPGRLLLAQNDCPGNPYGSFYVDNSGSVLATITTCSCHYFTGTVNPSSVSRGGTVSVTGTVQSCSTQPETVRMQVQATGVAGESCTNKIFSATTPAFTLAPGFSKSLTFPLPIPTETCPGSYGVSVVTYITSGPVAVDATSTGLLVLP